MLILHPSVTDLTLLPPLLPLRKSSTCKFQEKKLSRNLNAILLAFYTIFCPPLLQNPGVQFQFFSSCDLFLNRHFTLTLTFYSGVPLWHQKTQIASPKELRALRWSQRERERETKVTLCLMKCLHSSLISLDGGQLI